MYKGHIPNYVYNAPNKLFEYLTSGLDVWYPSVMVGSDQFITIQGFPKVLSIDFNDLSKFDLSKALERTGSLNELSFFCEDSLEPLIDKLIK